MHNGTLLAAVDLGSNSFRLEIGRFDQGHIQRTEYLKETVRLGGGLDEDHQLSLEAMQRGWACLARFAERLGSFPPAQVRAVATQTLREARNRDEFLRRGSEILGHTIDLVSGPEEARLIYQGVARLLPQSDERRLVVDIGGRSTELILGQQFEARAVASYRVGSVAWSGQHFPDGRFSAKAFASAEVAALAVLEDATAVFAPGAWDVAYGSSGTVGAVADILGHAGFEQGRIERAGLSWLKGQLLRAQSADRVRLEGLKDDRRPVIGGGISVLCAVFDLLGIDSMQVAQGALRLGDGPHLDPVAQQHDRHQRRQLLPERHAGVAESDGRTEPERDSDRESDQRHHTGQAILQLAPGALEENQAAVHEDRGPEEWGNPALPRHNGGRIPQDLRQHVSPDERGDRQRQRDPELVAEHGHAVPRVFVVPRL